MPLVGHVYKVTNPLEVFAPVIRGDALPTSSFEPWPRSVVIAHYYWEVPYFGFLPLLPRTDNPPAPAAGDGSFSLWDPAPEVVGQPFPVWVSLEVEQGPTFYRSGRISLSEAQFKELNLWLYVDFPSDPISAGDISKLVAGHSLPGNTIITAGGPYGGLNFTGSDGPVSIDFNIRIDPDTSPNLNDFLNLSIYRPNINAGWPESVDDVLNKLKSGIAAAGRSINQAVLQRMADILQRPPVGLTSEMASAFLSDVSVTFYSISYPSTPYPISHSWGIGNIKDDTPILVAHPCIGYPRKTLPLRFSTHP